MEENKVSEKKKMTYNKIISRRGYSIIKEILSSKELKALKKESLKFEG